jgi:hypothetical protein
LTQQDYAESWIWVHWILESDANLVGLLQNYLARLRITGEAPPFSRFLMERTTTPERSLVQHLQSLDR